MRSAVGISGIHAGEDVKSTGFSSPVWLADGALDAEGALTLDALLGVERPPDSARVRVVEITLRGNAAPPYARWFDLCPADTKENSLVGGWKEWSSIGYGVLLREKARRFIQNKVGSDAAVVEAHSLPDAPAAPPGVERWYVVPATSD